jgi:hypothetical protein
MARPWPISISTATRRSSSTTRSIRRAATPRCGRPRAPCWLAGGHQRRRRPRGRGGDGRQGQDGRLEPRRLPDPPHQHPPPPRLPGTPDRRRLRRRRRRRAGLGHDQDIVQVHELDGTKLWSAPITEGSGYAGCSAYDFDGDGAYELLLADEADFRIYDGATGAVRFIEAGHESNTVFEFPTVADVDNDGSAEILFVSNFVPNYGTLTVLGHADSAWLPVGSSWGNHDFAVTNLLQDGHVPAKPVPSWQTYNLFRARPSIDNAAVDLTVEIVDACVSGCADSGVATLAVQVFNTGFITVDAGVPVTLYRKDGDTLEPVETLVLPDPIPGGSGTAGLLFTVPVTNIGPDGLLVRVDDDGLGGSAHLECVESNNEAAWAANPC